MINEGVVRVRWEQHVWTEVDRKIVDGPDQAHLPIWTEYVEEARRVGARLEALVTRGVEPSRVVMSREFARLDDAMAWHQALHMGSAFGGRGWAAVNVEVLFP